MCQHFLHSGCIQKGGPVCSRHRFWVLGFFSGCRLSNLGPVSRRVHNGGPFYTFFLPPCRATSSPDFLCSLTALRTPCIYRCRGTLAFLFLKISSAPLR